MKIKNLWAVPEDMGEYGKEFFRRIGPKLVKNKRLADEDYYSFIALCDNHHMAKTALKQIERDGITVDGGRGVLKKHPAFAIYRVTFDNFAKLCNHFGLSPMARGEKFMVAERPSKKEKSVERFFKTVG